MNACPTGCGRKKLGRMVMCAPCWRLVPADLQKQIWVTQDARDKALSKGWDERAIETLRHEHAEAKAAAIEHVKERINQKELFA